ncbi:replication A 32 kDa subunit [Brachionus plicatilis]|uniref:Replication A 32 kDa subunit n=1 Tax=Brachionus plicatilis TaxID=10195 RepID=A0A3M7QU76_BRAPC|nr:replication A 32 kDa subunit [Brachionus plicatilis]
MWNDNEFNSTFSSPNANAGKEIKKNLIKYIVPVTGQTVSLCSQVEGESSIFEYNHLRFNQICIVGVIRSVIKRANDITYLVDDMTTNEIHVKLQTDDNDDMETDESKVQHTQFIENQYVKVFGIIKSLQNQKNVQAFRILPIKELNEISHHILDCMNASIYYITKGNENFDMQMSNPMNSVPTFGDNGGSSTSGLSGLYLNISSLIKQARTSEGVHIREICTHFNNYPENKIREALEFLSTEGHVYSTIDDEHFKSTDAM